MAVIRRVVYTDLPGQAKKVREKAGDLNSQLHTIYQSVDDMRQNWFGQRYNALITVFNGMIPDFNEIVKLMYMEVPSTLETIANNYSRVDRGQDITQVDNSLPKLIQDIVLSTEVGMRFQTAEVEQVKAKCIACFKDVLNFLDELHTLITNLSWESDASDKFREEFMRLKSKITTSIEQVLQQFDNSVAQTLADMQSTETANTVG